MLSRDRIIDRYIEFMSKHVNRSKDYVKDSYKNTFNIELVGLPNELTLNTGIKYIQDKYGYEFITSEVGVGTLENTVKSCMQALKPVGEDNKEQAEIFIHNGGLPFDSLFL